MTSAREPHLSVLVVGLYLFIACFRISRERKDARETIISTFDTEPVRRVLGLGKSDSKVTYLLKKLKDTPIDHPFSTSQWDSILGENWDLVREQTAVVYEMAFTSNKSSGSFCRTISVKLKLLYHDELGNAPNYRQHVRENKL